MRPKACILKCTKYYKKTEHFAHSMCVNTSVLSLSALFWDTLPAWSNKLIFFPNVTFDFRLDRSHLHTVCGLRYIYSQYISNTRSSENRLSKIYAHAWETLADVSHHQQRRDLLTDLVMAAETAKSGHLALFLSKRIFDKVASID